MERMMNNKTLVGVTLLFAGADDGFFEALLHSFIVSSSSLRELKETAAKIVPVTSITRDTKSSWQFIGIEDLFCVAAPLREGAMLGRTTLWDVDQFHEARAMTSDPGNPIERTNPAGESAPSWAVAEAVYFAPEKSNKEAFTIIANVLLDWRSKGLDNAALEVASSLDVISGICRCGSESMGDLEFVGIRAIRHVPEDIKTGGAMEKQSKRFSTLEEISNLVMPDEELDMFEFL